MALIDMQSISLTDDHTLETASEVMSQLQFDRRLPNGRQSYLKLLKELGFQSNQDGEQHTQHVFQGQCLILGDARVGKTSLKKSLVGESFDAEEPGTKGVEVSLVDRKWRNLDFDAGLTFGSFARFMESVLYKGAMYGPGGIEYTFNAEVTSTVSVLASFWFSLIRIAWVYSIIQLLASCTVSDYSFYAFSFAVIFLAILLHFLTSEERKYLKLAALFVTLPRFIIGFILVTVYLLTGLHKGIECSNFEFSFSEIISCMQYIDVAILWNHISVDLLFLTKKYFQISLTCTSRSSAERVESSLPGQARININSLPILPRFVDFIIPVITGASFGYIFELLTNIPTLQYCQTLHLTVLVLVMFSFYTCMQTLHGWGNWKGPLIWLLLVPFCLSSFWPLTTYMFIAMFAAYTDWENMLLPFNTVRGRQASFTFIFIEKVVLNLRKLKSALCGKFSSIKLKLLDFSGDEEYYAYHHMFMRDQAIYIVVFNMANFVDDHFGNIGAKTKRLCFWLESICSKAAPKTPIFLVGTHRGHMDKTCLKRIDKHLRQHLLHSFSDELVMNQEDSLLYFPTENTLGRNDRGIQNLQREIMSTAEEHKTTIGREIPYSWIKIQDAIINQRRNKNAKFCVTLQQFPVSVGNFICSNWSKETLKYFHEKGLVIYADPSQDSELSKWILLKPDILVDIIIQLVTPLTDEEVMLQHGFRRDWKLLHDTGMLTESLLENILSRLSENGKAIKGFLEAYDIICPLFFYVQNKEVEAQVTHFVPSLLPMSADVNTPLWLDGPDDKKVYVFFHRFLPEPLFQHLLSRAHKNSRAEFPKGQPVMCRDVGRFWLRPSQTYRLLRLKDEDMIEVTFNYREGQGMKPSDVLPYLFSMVSGICKQHFPYVRFHCGPLCPSNKCPGHQGDYISHPGVQQLCSRRHVFNVMPARQEATISSFYCVNQNFEEQLKEWVVEVV